MRNVRPQWLSASQLIATDNDNVVALPDPNSGRLGNLIASAGAPGQSHELSWEFGARAAFNTESTAWSNSTRRVRRSPAVVAVVAVTSLLVTTTGFAAATGLPGPAARVVDHVLKHIDLTVQPPEIGSAVGQSIPSGPTNPAAATSGSGGQVGSGNTASCSSTDQRSELSPVCGVATGHPVLSGSGDTSAGNLQATVGGNASTSTGNHTQKTGRSSNGTHEGGLGIGTPSNQGTSRGGTRPGDTGGRATGFSTGTGSNRGGNNGTGSNRGGNNGTGSNRGGNNGTGSNRGGNKGTGSNRGGNKGTGSGHHRHHRGSGSGTAIPDPGITSSDNDGGPG